MFKHILIPISSEFYAKPVLERGVFLAEKFNATIDLLYIIEEKTLNQADRRSNAFRTQYDRNETKREIIREQTHTADTIIFDDAKQFFSDKGIFLEGTILSGEFSKVIHREIRKKRYDLIVMGFDRACMLNYRLLDEKEMDIPIWVESQTVGSEVILAVCSNLAPNLKVPEIGVQMARLLGWELHLLYVIDVEDAVAVDKHLTRSESKSEDELFAQGEQFVSKMANQGIKTQLVRGSLEKETIKAAHAVGAGLVIVGRQQKEKGMLGLPARHVKRKMAQKCRYSILFIN
jgi:nucleotide-binding universal stress UspA family protein